MKKIVLFIVIIISKLFAQNAFAQKNNGSITGRIIAADGSPAYVTIELKKLNRITVTDNNGNFKLQNLPALKDTLIITSVESKVYYQPISLEKNEAAQLGDITLTLNIGRLQDVEVRGRIEQSFKSDYSFMGTKTQTPSINIPQSISAVTKELIMDKMDFTLKDIAGEVPGVNQYSGYDEYAIRGFKAENARLINGLRGYNTIYTSTMLVNIERIEIMKGPAATLYGNGDPGGTINLVTKKPLAINESEINISGGTWNHFRTMGDATGPLNKNKTLLYRINGGYDNSHSFRNQYYAKSYELAPSLSFIPNDKIQLNIDFSLSHINTILDRGQPGFQNDYSLKSTPTNLIASQPGDYLHETDIASSILFSYKINKQISFNSGYLNYNTQQDALEHGIHSYITPDSVNLYYSGWNYQTTTHSFTNYVTFHFNTGKFGHQFLAGFDYIKSSVNLGQDYYEQADLFGAGSGIVGTFSLKNPKYITRPISKYSISTYNSDAINVNASVYQTKGFYLQEQVSLNKLKILFGIREEQYKAGGSEADSAGSGVQNVFLPRIGLVFEIRPDVSLYATYNNGFDPFEATNSTQVFNEPFKPVTSKLFEAGTKANLFDNKLSASLALYQLTLYNVAVNANDISNPNLYIQQGEDRSAGMETEVNGNILPNLSISASYSYCIAKVIKSKIAWQEGHSLENAPANTSNSWIKYMFIKGPLKGFGIALGHSQESVRNTVEQGLALPGYLVLNGGIRYKNKHFIAAFNLNNFTNKTYWTGAYNNVNKWPGAPRNFMMSVGYNF
jgi:iron complex outermembrane receptor protein